MKETIREISKQRIVIRVICFLAYGLLLNILCVAQNISINTIGATAAPSAILDISSASSGILIPRVALTNAALGDHSADPVVGNPNNHLFVFNTNTTVAGGNGVGLYYYDSTNVTTGKWVYVAAPSNGPGVAGEVLLSGGANTSPAWGSLSVSGACLPTQISNQLWVNVNWMTCGTNCAGYAGTTAGDGGFTDWRIPSLEEYVYARQQFAAPTGGWQNLYFWTSELSSTLYGYWIVFVENTGDFNTYIYTWTSYCRCVR